MFERVPHVVVRSGEHVPGRYPAASAGPALTLPDSNNVLAVHQQILISTKYVRSAASPSQTTERPVFNNKIPTKNLGSCGLSKLVGWLVEW